jgi:hypothetical protein
MQRVSIILVDVIVKMNNYESTIHDVNTETTTQCG